MLMIDHLSRDHTEVFYTVKQVFCSRDVFFHCLSMQHQAVLADEQLWCQRRLRREQRRPAASCRCIRLGWRQTISAAGQHEEGHDIHGRFEHGPCTRSRQTLSCLTSPGQSTLITSRQSRAGQRRPRSCSSRPPWATC